jgi:hypothetical protein
LDLPRPGLQRDHLLGSYFEGTPHSEPITRYKPTVEFDTIASNGIPDLASLTTFKDLQFVWNTATVDGFESRVHGGLRIFTFISQFVTNDIILQKSYPLVK